MKTRQLALLAMAAAAALASAESRAGAPAKKDAAPQFDRTTPVKAYLRVEGKEAKVTIIGRTALTIIFLSEGSPLQRQMKIEDIENTTFSDIKIDRNALFKALRKRDWMSAVGLLLPPLKPYLPLLDLPDNNVAREVLDVGDYMMRAAQYNLRAEATDSERQLAKKQYGEAFEVLKYVSKANWSSMGMIARLKSLKCVLEMGKPKTARFYFEKTPVPVPGDAAFGLYWLLKAELDVEKKDFRPAMDAAVKSLCFENKDIDTFPDALLVSARCYEEFQEWHRARDVYYEVARIFPQTDWAELALERLGFIMKAELTKKDEEESVESAFFSLKDDMNKLAKEYLAAYRSKRGIDEAEEEEKREREKDLDLKKAKDFGEDEKDKDKDKDAKKEVKTEKERAKDADLDLNKNLD